MSRSSRVRCLVLAVLVFGLCLVVPGCKSRVTKANYDKINNGMTLAEVEAILGKGTKEEGDGSNVAAQFGVHVAPAAPTPGVEIYVWGNNKVTFTNGKVQMKPPWAP